MSMEMADRLRELQWLALRKPPSKEELTETGKDQAYRADVERPVEYTSSRNGTRSQVFPESGESTGRSSRDMVIE